MTNQNVFEYILTEETAYQTTPVPVVDGWDFHMFRHIKVSTLLKYGQLESGKTDQKPVDNIIRPILNVAYRSEGFDVKDIEMYVDNADNYYKSFLVRKLHNRWSRKYKIDKAIDQTVESDADYGLALVKDVNGDSPEPVPLQRIAFCDQTDVLSGPICEKHMYSPDQLINMAEEAGWYRDKIDEAITAAEDEKSNSQSNNLKQKTPGRYIEVYELEGMLPSRWLKSKEDGETELENEDKIVYTLQKFIVVFPNRTLKDNKKGIILYQGKLKQSIYKAKKRDDVYGRACGYGGVEELYESQVWTTYNLIQMKEMLDAAALMLQQTTDASFGTKNKTSNLEKNEIVVTADGTRLDPVNVSIPNFALFENAVTKWQNSARTTGSANDAQLGENPSSGTPFKLQDLVVQQGMGIHEYRKGRMADFWEEIYRDWVIPRFAKDLTKDTEWVDDLSLDELQWLAEQVTTKESNKKIKEIALRGEIITPEQADEMRKVFKDNFMKGGSKRFFKIFGEEMEKLPLDVFINIAGKQNNLNAMTDKIVNIVRQVIANPQVLQIPGMAKLFNEIIEYSGLSPVDFTGLTAAQTAPVAPAQPIPAGQQPLPEPALA